MNRTVLSAIVLFLPTLVNCVGASSERVVAAQQALDAFPPTAIVHDGWVCPSNRGNLPDPTKYSVIKEAHVGTLTQHDPFEDVYGKEKGRTAQPESCRLVTWDPSAKIKDHAFNEAPVAIGTYVLQKLGDDEQEMGTLDAPIRAVFEPSQLGKELLAAGLATSPPRTTVETTVYFAKDADGHLQGHLMGPPSP